MPIIYRHYYRRKNKFSNTSNNIFSVSFPTTHQFHTIGVIFHQANLTHNTKESVLLLDIQGCSSISRCNPWTVYIHDTLITWYMLTVYPRFLVLQCVYLLIPSLDLSQGGEHVTPEQPSAFQCWNQSFHGAVRLRLACQACLRRRVSVGTEPIFVPRSAVRRLRSLALIAGCMVTAA